MIVIAAWKVMAKAGDVSMKSHHFYYEIHQFQGRSGLNLAYLTQGSAPTDWSTWMDARSSWPAGGVSSSIASGVPTLTTRDSGTQAFQFGIECTQAHRLRLEILNTAGGLFFKTYEIGASFYSILLLCSI